MRVATWNVNGLRARLEFVQLWLQDRQPDVVGLQEIKMVDAQFPHEAFAELGYQAAVHGQPSWNGVAILTKQAAEVVQVGLPGQEEFGARLLTVQVDGLLFTCVYCPNGKDVSHDDYPRKLAWFDSLLAYLQTQHCPDIPHIIGGDFNVCPTALDSWHGESADGGIFHTDAERQRIQRILDWGVSDLFRAQFPREQVFSWWDYRGGAFHKKQGLRIDFLLGTAPTVDRLSSIGTDRDYRKKQNGLTASDHAPVIAELT